MVLEVPLSAYIWIDTLNLTAEVVDGALPITGIVVQELPPAAVLWRRVWIAVYPPAEPLVIVAYSSFTYAVSVANAPSKIILITGTWALAPLFAGQSTVVSSTYPADVPPKVFEALPEKTVVALIVPPTFPTVRFFMWAASIVTTPFVMSNTCVPWRPEPAAAGSIIVNLSARILKVPVEPSLFCEKPVM